MIRLFRLRLALLNGVSAVAGCLLFPAPAATGELLGALFGVALLAAGASALNQVLERDLDLLMVRTRLRPLPSGKLTPGTAAAIGGLCMMGGLLVLGAVGGSLPLLLGMAAIVWYLGIYTPLKRRTSLALPSGAVCGAFPPLIGWCLAGGNPADYRVILLAGLLYLWQIPHFWLFQRRHADDYRRAGLPLFAPRGNGAHTVWLCRLWIVAVVAAAMLLPLFGLIHSPLALWYAAFPVSLIALSRTRSESVLFSCLNLLPVLVALVLWMQKMSMA